MRIRIMASRHSAFYSPLLACVRLLRDEGHDAPYSVLGAGQQTYVLIRDGVVDVVQSAVSSNWKARERGVEPLPVHFAQINQRDGFFLTGREPDPAFDWKKLEGRTLLPDPGDQPLAMLKYAVKQNGAEWARIKILRKGEADYTHQQGPVASGEIVASVGASMPPVAFSSLCSSRAHLKTDEHRVFVQTFQRAREWVRSARPEEVAAAETEFFPGVSVNCWRPPSNATRTLGAGKGMSRSRVTSTSRR